MGIVRSVTQRVNQKFYTDKYPNVTPSVTDISYQIAKVENPKASTYTAFVYRRSVNKPRSLDVINVQVGTEPRFYSSNLKDVSQAIIYDGF